MKEERDDLKKATIKTYEDGENGNIIETIEYDSGMLEEKVKTQKSGFPNYYIRKTNKHNKRIVLPLFCPKCDKIMDGMDTKIFLEAGCCGKCESVNLIPWHKLNKKEVNNEKG